MINHNCVISINVLNNFRKESITDFFFLTPKSGYFEDCTLESNIIEDTINLSSFSILTNNHDVLTEMSFFNKSTNVSKIVYCNETLFQNEVNESPTHNYGKLLSFKILKIFILIKKFEIYFSHFFSNL